MAYIGTSPSQGVRHRYLFTATSGQTTFSGADDDSRTLSYTDTKFMDVFLNGVLLDPNSDYTATNGTSVVLTSGASAGDLLEVIAFDSFSVFSGTFGGDVTVGGAFTSQGNVGIGTNSVTAVGPNYGTLGINGSGGGGIKLEQGGTTRGVLYGNTGGLSLSGEGATNITFYTDGSEAARFNTSGNLAFPNGQGIDFSASAGGGASSSILDDYEEGDWTLTFTTNSTNISTASSTYAKYTKIGNIVKVTGNVSVTLTSSTIETWFSFTLPFTAGGGNAWGDNGSAFIIAGSGQDRFGVGSVLNPTLATTIGGVYFAANQINSTGSADLRFQIVYQTLA